MQRDLQTLRNIENQRLQTLRAKHKDTYDAVMWLRENKDKFKGSIHVPIMLCVSKLEDLINAMTWEIADLCDVKSSEIYCGDFCYALETF